MINFCFAFSDLWFSVLYYLCICDDCVNYTVCASSLWEKQNCIIIILLLLQVEEAEHVSKLVSE